MLLPRVITALVLLALLLPSLMASSPLPFAVLTLLLIGAAGWEWVRLNGWGAAASLLGGALVASTCVAAWWAGCVGAMPAGAWWVVTACWVLGGGVALRVGPGGWPRVSPTARVIIGVVVLCAAWLALSAARQRGLNFLLSAFCVVWMADVAAYVGGRSFGRRKLAVAISPGKSWEGVWSGMVGVLVLACLWLAFEQAIFGDQTSIFSVLKSALGWAGLVLGVVFLCCLSVTGDLVESLAKRAAGVKDSSGLLPGHGGVLDRVDALLPVLPAVMALTTLG